MVRGLLETKEDTVRLVTRFEVANRSTTELRSLRKRAFAAAASAPPCSQDRRDALTSIHNIRNELARRFPRL